MVPTRAHSPHVPLAVEEIVRDAARCVRAGASMVHLHARDADGEPSADPGLMRELIIGLREQQPGVIVTVTTSGRREPELAKRAAVLDLDGAARPDMASLTLGSLNFLTSASVNAPATIQGLAERMLERGIKAELEVFDLGMINVARRLIDQDLLRPPFYFNLLLGNLATAQTKLLHLAALLADLPAGSVVGLAGLGRFQLEATALATVVADAARIGLEDSLHYDADRRELATNEGLVQRLVRQAEAVGRSVATPWQVRQRLGLQKRP